MWLLPMYICYTFVLQCSARTIGEEKNIHQQSKINKIIKYGSHNMSYLSLKSLETHYSPPCINDIKKADPCFRVGWLHDEIVDSYLFLLELKFSHVLYCGYVEARVIVAGKSMKCLWKNQLLLNKELFFVPYNPSGVH